MLFFNSFSLLAMHEEAVREGSREEGKDKVVREGSREKGSYKVVREGSRERGKDIRRRSFSSFSPPIFRGAQERSTDRSVDIEKLPRSSSSSLSPLSVNSIETRDSDSPLGSPIKNI